MADFAFDTYRAVKSLQAAGFDASQAEAVVDAIGTANGVRGNYATKDDLDDVEQALRKDIDDVEQALRKDIATVEQSLGARLDVVETGVAALQVETATLKAALEATERNLNTRIDGLNTRIDGLNTRINDVEKNLIARIGSEVKNLEQKISNSQLRTMLWGTTVVVGLAAWITFLDRIRAFLGLG